MSYRRTNYTELCAACREQTTWTCPRCGLPLCDAHTPAAAARCLRCESEFERRVWVERKVIARNDTIPYPAVRRPIAAFALSVLCVLFAFGPRWLEVALVLASIVIIWRIPPSLHVATARLADKRHSFMRERKRAAVRAQRLLADAGSYD